MLSGKGHFKTRDDLLIDKSSKDPIPYFSNDIIEWGVKYEPMATIFYEKLNNLTVLEFGLDLILNLKYLEHLQMVYVMKIHQKNILVEC